ncbi:MAG: alpha/beta fold hydrolase [Bryobacteraceae bacterium]
MAVASVQLEPLLRRHQNDAIDRVNSLRIRTMDVNEHFGAELFGMDLRPGLANVRCPVLVGVGEHDILAPPHLARELVDALPAGLGRLEVVPDASHEVLTDNSDAAWAAIRGFIDLVH